MDMIITAREVKYIRETLGETQDQFAKRMGISRASVVNYEKGTQIPESKQPFLRELYAKVTTEDIKSVQSDRNEKAGISLVPYYNIDFTEPDNLVLEDREKMVPDYYMDVPEFRAAPLFAFTLTAWKTR